MDIGIIGSGSIGATAARLFAGAGHNVAISNSRGPESLRDLVSDIGENASAASVDEAADFGEVVLVAIPFFAYEALPADRLSGKIVVDATNYYPGRDGEMDFGGLTSSEVISGHLSGALLVKAFNTMYYETLATGGDPSDNVQLVLFVSGDEVEAKSVVSRLIEEIGFAPKDLGSLKGSSRQQPGSPIYNVRLTREQARETLEDMD
ncbi:MAG: NAD(P)-binding domain-containing protein [Rubrobacter sp.]|nr:NAD(P)-binding domain-containing protein [Rubrobacter sp.]